MKRLIVSDLDGTLLLPRAQQLEPHVLDMIEELLDAGYLFAAASGRQYPNLHRMFGRVAKRLLYICENGSLVIQDEQILYKGTIEQELCSEIISKAYERETSEILLSGAMHSYIHPRSAYFYNLVANRMKNDFILAEDLRKVGDDCVKLSVYEQQKVSSHQEEEWIRAYSKKLTVVRSSEKWLDFMPKGTNKGKALRLLMKENHIEASQCIAFGDQDNDRELLAEAGESYAMIHGSSQLKKLAGNVIAHPTEIFQKLLQGK